MFFQQPLVGHNMFMDLCHLHDKFYKPLPGNAVRVGCPCLCPRQLPLQQGRGAEHSGHSAPQQVALQCLVLVASSALRLLEQGIIPQVKYRWLFLSFITFLSMCFAFRKLRGV